MDEAQQAHHEIDLLQGIINRHEGHMFALRGWLLAIVGGLLAAYYTQNINISELMLQTALVIVAFLFLVLESRHVNLVEAVVERVAVIEKSMNDARRPTGELDGGWYHGPRINATCQKGAARWWPRRGMTFVLNQPFYFVVVLVIVLATVSLPARADTPPSPVAAQRSAQN